MSSINKYLIETPLTSTKNTLLKENSCASRLEEFELGWTKRNIFYPRNRRLLQPDTCVLGNLIQQDACFTKENISKQCLTAKKRCRKIRNHIEPDDCFAKKKKAKKILVDENSCRDIEIEESEIEDQFLSDFVHPSCMPVMFEYNAGMASDFSFSDRSLPVFGSSQSNALFGTPATAFARSAPRMAYSAMPGSSAMFGNVVLESLIPEKNILKMPTYELDVVKLHEDTQYEIFSSHSDDSSCLWENSFAKLKGKKMQLLNVVSMALMYSSNLKDKNDTYRIILQQSADAVRLIDPEFILKVAMYARQELQIRTVTNFLLSYAALHQNTRIYLEKYFNASIILPTDWIQVAEFYQVLRSDCENQPFPAALRRIMMKTFPKFDKYQLAKYNRNRIRKKKENKMEQDSAEKNSSDDDEKKTSDDEKSDDICKENLETKSFRKLTLKQLIRRLHINSPSEHVMCLLGKKYPKTHQEFKSCGLPGTWDPTKASTRMKFPVPETWETQISAKGNKADVWESLIDNNKLPYMAMLRNLKNLICSEISQKHHMKVIKYLGNKKSVINSRQLPMQFFEAYKVVNNLEKMLEGTEVKPIQYGKKEIPAWKKGVLQKTKEWIDKVHTSGVTNTQKLLFDYKCAITNALEYSSLNNLHPIPGKTLVICQIDSKGQNEAKIKSYETCIMIGLMCLRACEDCKMNILSFSNSPDEISLNEDDRFLDVLVETCDKYEKRFSDLDAFDDEGSCIPDSSLQNILDYFLKPHSVLSVKLDHIIFLQTLAGFESVMSSFLHKYRQIVNPDLLYTNVNFTLSNKSFSSESSSDKDVYLCGSSSSLIKFIAERSSGGQLTYVENIDMKYNLEVSDLKKMNNNLYNSLHEVEPLNICDTDAPMPFNYKLPKWHTVRIFVSSTFKDMISERDLFVRYVFPELRRRAASVFIRIVEIDLRWGITESDSSTKRAAEICLTEAQTADLFVGLVGERYGTIYNFEPTDDSDLEWVKSCPTGLSITELEMHAAALRNPKSSQKKALFYFRDTSFLGYVPKKWADHFASEDLESKKKVLALKDKIRSSKFKIFDDYPCHWAGIFENKPILGGLNVLGNRVLEDLWNAVQEIHKADPYGDSVSEEEMYQQNLLNSKKFCIGTKNSPLENVLHQIKSEQGIFVVCGAPGSGKTTFAINLLKHLNLQIVVKFFIGISPRSRDLCYMAQYIWKSICHHLGVIIPLPNSVNDIANHFSDFLLEAANCCGGRDLILLIDGLDHLEINYQWLDWLPLLLPNRVKLVCTVSESSQAFKVLCERKELGNAVFIQELSSWLQSDREQFVRKYLSYYRKTLDETAFNNHMLKIVTKKDSCNPFYLRIVCDFLRIYASFDNLVSMLQKLPSSTVLLFQEIILQMENEFGSTLIQTVLTLLCITKEGLEDNDLHYILSFLMHLNEMKTSLSFDELKEKLLLLEPENLLCQVKYHSLMYVISMFTYGQIRQKSFSLMGTEFETAVKKFYINKNYFSHCDLLHSALSAYFHNMCDVQKDGKFSGQSGFAFRCLLYHMNHGSLYKELSYLLCNHKFIEAVFRNNADDQLLEYYSSIIFDVLPENRKLACEIEDFNLFSFYDFVSRNIHIFHQYPQLVMQQALNEPRGSEVSLKNGCNYYSIENLSRAGILDYRIATICGFVKNITAAAGEMNKPFVILGSEDGYLKVLDVSTRKVVRTIKGHSSAITCICFVGKNRICASSMDATLSLWDSDDFTRIAVLTGHRHKVTSCCSDPFGSILFSSGWDNSVRLWSLSDGRSISVIEDFRCPVNCIDHHPIKQEIACGLWNGNIEIWDTVSMLKKLVFSNISGSVKSLAYTQDGVNIISSFIQSEMSIWSSEEGLKIASLKGHILPVKSLTYSFNDSLFVSGSDDCTLKVWSAAHASNFSTVSESKFCPVSLMEFMTENLLAITFQNSEIWIIDINSGNIINKTTLTSDTVSALSKYSSINLKYQYSENNWWENSLVFGTQSGKVMIKDFLSSTIITKVEMNSKITAVSHNCNLIFCGTAEGDIGVCSHPDNKLAKILFAAHKGFISYFSFSIQCGKFCALSTANDNILKLWSIEWVNSEVTLQQEFFNKHKDGVTCSLFYPEYCDENVLDNLLTGSHDNNIISWNGNAAKVFHGLQSSVVNIACSGDYILGCGNDGAIVMWSHNGTVLTSIPKIELSSATLTFYVTEDKSDKFAVILAFVDQDGSIKIRKPLQKTYCCSFDSHSKPITSCCTTANGEVISCSLDGSVSLWKVQPNISDSHFMHSSVITGTIISLTLEFAVSSDAQGNLILWKTCLDASAEPLIYAGRKSYNEGFIRALSWLKNNSFVCAVTQVIESQETYFLDIIQCNCNSETQTAVFSLEFKKSYTFESEVLCLDSCSSTDTIIVGLKSGDVMVITTKSQRLVKMGEDWLLGVRLFTRENSSDIFCASFIDGSVKLFSIAEFFNLNTELPSTFAVYEATDAYKGPRFTSSMCCGEDRFICCGDSEGILRVYSKHSMIFTEKVHNDSISGICIVGTYLFTSSLDKTVKVWSLKSLKQVCQFHSHSPISCMSSSQTSVDISNLNSLILLIGTTSGNVYLLKFHCK